MTGRRILIVGGSSVLGRGCAGALDGTRLWLTHCRSEPHETLRHEFPAATVSQVNVEEPSTIDSLMSRVKEEWGGLEGLVYAAGAGLLWPAVRTDDRRWEEVFRVNVLGAQRILRGAFPLLCEGDRPAVVLISSVMGLAGAGGMAAYGASKSAVAGLARTLAVEWASRGVRVNAVAPGIVPSPLVDGMFKYLSPEQQAAIRDRHPMGLGRPEDVGSAVAFLLSPESARWITGVVLPVDGGYTAQ